MNSLSRRGFSLVELMVTILISAILIGGTIATFNAINIGVKNTNRGNDLTAAVRNATTILQADLSEAGRGLSDLTTLQIHFTSDVAEANEQYFYGIVGLPKLNGFSQICFQWFDYDPAGEPTFVVMNPVSAPGGVWTSPVTTMDLVSNTADAGVGEGDIFVLYDPRILYDRDLHQSLYTSINVDYSFDETTASNGAMMLQVASAAALGNTISVTFGADGVFSNGITPPTNQYLNNETDYGLLVNNALVKGKDEFQFKPPAGVWLARKLGNGNSYRRVRYFVNSDNALIRRDESTGTFQDLVVATNVTNFEFEIGTDILDPTNPVDQVPSAWNNAVSYDDADQWFDSATTPSEMILLGRHGVSARFKLEIEALIQDINESATGDVYKTRTVERTFKIRNQHRPQVNY